MKTLPVNLVQRLKDANLHDEISPGTLVEVATLQSAIDLPALSQQLGAPVEELIPEVMYELATRELRTLVKLGFKDPSVPRLGAQRTLSARSVDIRSALQAFYAEQTIDVMNETSRIGASARGQPWHGEVRFQKDRGFVAVSVHASGRCDALGHFAHPERAMDAAVAYAQRLNHSDPDGSTTT